jgi:polyisoprenoid-binding protein YceI
MNRWVTLGITVLSVACNDKPKDQPPPQATATAAAAAVSVAPKAVAKESTPAEGATRFMLYMGKGTFKIDAPLEKIKGGSSDLRGTIDVDPKNLSKTHGDIMVRLSTLKTNTFGETDKDAAQTEHARNWMEVGYESPADARMKYEWATLTVTSVDATPASLADTREEGGVRKVKAKVSGDLSVHGITSKKSVPVTVTFKGPAEAPTEMTIVTDEPMPVSLKEHDVKPRDGIGSFLNGALERIGKKIDDKVQVSFEANAKASMPSHP